ncbi:hypothetical protein [Spirosoma flavum]|uniref:Uncharacterized protein n=1 Tax=Spirosoma flavum TaxID=2048557 RepID=A0ABW6ALH9_9BACT
MILTFLLHFPKARKRLLCLALFLFGSGLVVSGQSTGFSARQVTLTDTVLLNTIKKYNHNIQKKEVMVIGVAKRQDTLIYYITGMISLFRLSQNIPLLYAKISNQYILLYSGIEPSVQSSLPERKQLLAIFKTRLQNDLLANGKRDLRFMGSYDPIEVTVMTKRGKRVYEDFKKGFGPNSFPYFIYE